MGPDVPDGRSLRGVNLTRLSAIHADARYGFLVGSVATFVPVWFFARHQYWRDPGGAICGGRRWYRLLPQPLVHRLVVVGGGCHAGWDWAQSYFYGTSDSGLIIEGHLLSEHPTGPALWSGGTTGPEGSLLIFVLLAIMSLVMWLWWGRRVKSPFRDSGWRPAWSRKPTLETSPVGRRTCQPHPDY